MKALLSHQWFLNLRFSFKVLKQASAIVLRTEVQPNKFTNCRFYGAFYFIYISAIYYLVFFKWEMTCWCLC